MEGGEGGLVIWCRLVHWRLNRPYIRSTPPNPSFFHSCPHVPLSLFTHLNDITQGPANAVPEIPRWTQPAKLDGIRSVPTVYNFLHPAYYLSPTREVEGLDVEERTGKEFVVETVLWDGGLGGGTEGWTKSCLGGRYHTEIHFLGLFQVVNGRGVRLQSLVLWFKGLVWGEGDYFWGYLVIYFSIK